MTKSSSIALVIMTLAAASAGSSMLFAKEAKPVAAPVPAAPAAFTDSSAAQLAGTKRVAITSVVIQFQASTNAVDGPGAWFTMFSSKNTSETILGWPGMSANLQADFAEFAYSKLKADLESAGFEVVPEAQVKASANYQAIIKQGGIPARTEFANAMGDAYFISPANLPGYIPYTLESGPFANVNSYIGFVTNGFGQKSRTPGGPSLISVGNNWKIPGMENALAKELNAHIVKATYVVGLGRATAKRSREVVARTYRFDSVGNLRQSGKTTQYGGSGEVLAQPSLMPQQTRIAFRTAQGSPKWQKVSMTKVVPPKDGDVVVHLVEDMQGSTDHFSMTSRSKHNAGFLMPPGGPNFKLIFSASLEDEPGYKQEVGGMIATANRYMLGLVQR